MFHLLIYLANKNNIFLQFFEKHSLPLPLSFPLSFSLSLCHTPISPPTPATHIQPPTPKVPVLPESPQQPGVGQLEASDWVVNPDLSHGQQKSDCFAHLLLPPVSMELCSGVEVRLKHTYHHGLNTGENTHVPNIGGNCLPLINIFVSPAKLSTVSLVLGI